MLRSVHIKRIGPENDHIYNTTHFSVWVCPFGSPVVEISSLHRTAHKNWFGKIKFNTEYRRVELVPLAQIAWIQYEYD